MQLFKKRPSIGSVTLSVIVALYLVSIFNKTFWKRVFIYFHYDWMPITAIIIGMVALFVAITVFASAKYITKPIFILFICVGSISSWFTDQFGAIIDNDMVANAYETTSAEAGNLITPDFLLHLLMTALLPAFLIIWIKVKHRPFGKKVFYNLLVVLPCLAIAAVSALSISRILISTMREHQDLAKVINPFIPIKSAVRFALDEDDDEPTVVNPIGLDARVVPVRLASGKPRVTIVVAGETARAANFSLGGYDKPTNPELAKRNVMYFANTSSCGTQTAKSIPCMFSVYPQKEYSGKKAASTQTLPDVLSHAGLNVEWWENNTGSKGVAYRVKNVNFYGSENPDFCKEGECYDTIMLDDLGRWLDNVTEDSVLFVHQLGSHGPAYFERYPDHFRRFKPDCRGAEFSDCTIDEIRNAYDNTILYTDYFLSQIIDKLEARADKLSGAMFYMSDHGESLGENGLYLHSMPIALAPKEQTHIPFVLWMSEPFAQGMALDLSCMRKNMTERALSHDNLFPSVLTMMNVQTEVKDKKLDMFGACQMGQLATGK